MCRGSGDLFVTNCVSLKGMEGLVGVVSMLNPDPFYWINAC